MDERIADSMPDGAIHWSAETDKVGLLHVTPISEPVRAELDRYLRAHPRIGEAPLFPSDEADGTPLRTDVSARWLLDAEAAAELPKLEQGVWHPYRRLWASERKHLPPDVDVAAAGSWKDTVAPRKSYQHADPDTILAVVQHGA